MQLIMNFIGLFMAAAPWLLLGLFIAGLIKAFVATDTLSKHMGGNDIKSIVKATFIGAPLPLCSCGVLPAALGLRRSGASKSSTVAFLVATPETGVDSVSVSYALLGPFMAIVRPIAAIISAIVAGLLVGNEEKNEKVEVVTQISLHEKSSAESSSSCCNSKIKPVIQSSCCSTKTSFVSSFKKKFVQALTFTSYDLIKDTLYWLLIGLFFAAIVQTYLPGDFLETYGHGILAMLLMVVISIPMYICATASTPIAAGLMMAGVSPGAALVFMLAGPATNIAALGLVAKELGRRALVAYLTGVIGTALVMGLLVDYFAEQFDIMPVITMQEQSLVPVWLTITTSLLLTVLMVRVLIKSWIKK